MEKDLVTNICEHKIISERSVRKSNNEKVQTTIEQKPTEQERTETKTTTQKSTDQVNLHTTIEPTVDGVSTSTFFY